MVFLGKLRGNQDILFASWEPAKNVNIFTKLKKLLKVKQKSIHIFELKFILWLNTVECIFHLVKRLRVYTVQCAYRACLICH